jgi:hypothetical protein
LLQSWAWGDVQAGAGWRVERVPLGGAGLASVQVRGRSGFERGYVPRGPVPAGEETFVALAEWARERRLVSLKVEPEAPPGAAAALRGLGFRPAPFVQPQHTLIVPLPGEEEVMAGFKRGTRYNVRLADRKGVKVAPERNPEEMARQAAASATRQGIALPTAAYFGRLLELLPGAVIYVARVDGAAVGALLVVHFEGRGYDLYSGSNGKASELKPMYLVKWEALRGAIAAGCRDYDMWGVSPGPDRTHPWYGLWEFKSGFGGELVEYAGCWELVLDESRRRIADTVDRGRRRLGRVLRRVG